MKRGQAGAKESEHNTSVNAEEIITQELLKQGNNVDIKLNSLVSQALQQKEAMIKVLEAQLEAERKRREEVQERFKNQLKEFEEEREALERIRKASNALEKKHIERSSTMQDTTHNHTSDTAGELDMIPTKETQRSKPAKKNTNTSVQSYRPDRVKSSIPKVTSAKPSTANNSKLQAKLD